MVTKPIPQILPGPKRRRADILKIVEESLRRLAKPETVTLTITRRITDPMLWVDRAQMVQTLLNLETNAVEAMPAGGELSLDVAGDEHRIIMTIADTGRGIPPEFLDQLFIPYFTTKPGGLGLGLPLAYAAVKSHAGDMAIESNADPGRGSTGTRIVITLPRGAPATPGRGRLIIHDD